MTFSLPQLPYSPTDLVPFLSQETFDFHYGKHHATYVNKLNDAIQGKAYENETLENIIRISHQNNELPVFNNAAQHWNHSFFWNCLTPQKNMEIPPLLKAAIEKQFESVSKFQEIFVQNALSVFGSGWAWLSKTADNKLEIQKLSNADSPLLKNDTALLTIDVWEHAYYIDYRNDRAKFVNGFWEHANWDFADKNFLAT